jgi:hypothetical protein
LLAHAAHTDLGQRLGSNTTDGGTNTGRPSLSARCDTFTNIIHSSPRTLRRFSSPT